MRFFEVYKVSRMNVDYAPPSIYPDSHFELSIVMDETDSTARPVDIIEGLAFREVQEVSFLTVFRGEQFDAGKKSVSYRVRCGLREETLTSERVNSIMEKSIQSLEKAGYQLR